MNRTTIALRKNPARVKRRGSLYLQVVMVTTLVSLMGLTAISVSRVRRRMYEQGAGSSQARYYAQSAIRMAFQRIEANKNWRFDFPNGAWETDTPFADGSFSITGVDPSDNDLTDDAEDPVVITGIGKHGGSEHKVQVTIAPTRRGMACLKHAAHCTKRLHFHGGTLYCNQVVSSEVDADGHNTSHIYSDVAPVAGVTGETFYGATRDGETLEMPVFPDVLTYYLANGTHIQPSSLETSFPQVARNGDFEDGISEWDAYSCVIESSDNNPHGGATCLRVTDRNSGNDGVRQTITGVISKGKPIDIKAWIRSSSYQDEDFWFRLEIETDSGTSTINSGSIKINEHDPWTLLSKTLTPTWTGTLLSIKLRILSTYDLEDFYVDDLTVQQQGTDKCMVGKLLSPNHNPYGSPNPQGIYILDMADEKVFINFCRIYGTLILIKPGGGSIIGEGGTVVMEPAQRGMPAIICSEKELKFKGSINVGLIEAHWQTNFNPDGAPYDGVTNATTADTYVGEIRGMILAEKKVKFENSNALVTGSIYSTTDELEVKESTLTLNYDPASYLSPPPGFISGDESIRILLNSAKRPVD